MALGGAVDFVGVFLEGDFLPKSFFKSPILIFAVFEFNAPVSAVAEGFVLGAAATAEDNVVIAVK